MAGLARAFVAVVPPPPVRSALVAAVRDARAAVGPAPGLRWVPPAHWHVTLRFLGAVAEPERVVTDLAARLTSHRPVTVRLGGVGTFPVGGRGAVVWAGVHDVGADARLADLAAVVDTVPCDRPAPTRPFRAHLSLARAPEPPSGRVEPAVSRALGRHSGTTAPWVATEVVVVSSVPGPEGHRHEVVARCPLGA